MDCPFAKIRQLMERLHTLKLKKVDLPKSNEEPMELDLPPSGQNHHQPIAFRQC